MATAIVMDPSTRVHLEHTSNDPVPDTQKREVERSISELQDEKRLINADIAKIKLIWGRLESQLKSKNNRLTSLKAIISPMKYLPNELISKIFEDYAVGLSQPPWLLGHICARWREIALTTPTLWNTFEIRLPYSSFNREKTLFRRGRTTLISCTVALNWSSPSIRNLLQLFTQYVGCLRHLSLASIDTLLPLFELPGGSLSSLEVLDLSYRPSHVHAITFPGRENPATTFFEGAPKLRNVSIATYSSSRWENPEFLLIHLPWAQLTHLLLSPYLNVSCRVIRDVLGQCISLTTCRLSLPEEDPDSEQLGMPVIELRNMQKLEIANGYISPGIEDSRLLRHLILPSLKHLVLNPASIKARWPEDDIVNLILRSACKLEVFHFKSTLDNFIVTLLNLMLLSLKELKIMGTRILLSILQQMVKTSIFPNLRLIKCDVGGFLKYMVVNMMEALGETGFTGPFLEDGVPLSIVLIGEKWPPEARLDGLQRNRLKTSYQWMYTPNF